MVNWLFCVSVFIFWEHRMHDRDSGEWRRSLTDELLDRPGVVQTLGNQKTPFGTLMCYLAGKILVVGQDVWWVDNIEKDDRDLGLKGAWKERATDRIGYSKRNGYCGFRFASPLVS